MDNVTTKVRRLFTLYELVQSGLPDMSAKSMAIILGVSRRTVFRYISILRNCEISVHYSESVRGFRVAEVRGDLRRQLTAIEAASLFTLSESLNASSNIPIFANAARAALKVLESLRQEQKRLSGVYCKYLCVIQEAKQYTREQITMMESVHGAAMSKMAVRLRIKKSRVGSTLFCPYSVVVRNGAVEFIGRSSVERRIVSVELANVIAVEQTDDGFVRPARFCPRQYLSSQESMFLRKAG